MTAASPVCTESPWRKLRLGLYQWPNNRLRKKPWISVLDLKDNEASRAMRATLFCTRESICGLALASNPAVNSSGDVGMSRLRVSSKDVASWCETKPLHEVISAVEEIGKQGTQVTREMIYNLIQNCIKKKDVAAAKRAHTLMLNSGHVVAPLGDQLIRFFTYCGCLLEATTVFNSILFPSVHTWHAIILAHSVCGQKVAALSLYHRMQQQAAVKPNTYIFSCVLKACSGLGDLRQGTLTHSEVIKMSLESDSVVGTALVDLYSKCNKLQEARKVFENIKCRNVISWNAMLTGYVQHRQCLPAFDLFERMQKDGVKPDKVTFLCIVKACGSLGSPERCKLLHEQVIQSGLVSDIVVGNTLVDMYAKCGELQRANEVFENLPVRNVVGWSTIIAGYVRHGHGLAALEIFQEMQEEGIRPEKDTHSMRIAFQLLSPSRR